MGDNYLHISKSNSENNGNEYTLKVNLNGKGFATKLDTDPNFIETIKESIKGFPACIGDHREIEYHSFQLILKISESTGLPSFCFSVQDTSKNYYGFDKEQSLVIVGTLEKEEVERVCKANDADFCLNLVP